MLMTSNTYSLSADVKPAAFVVLHGLDSGLAATSEDARALAERCLR
jgi:hypothetical protein